MLRNLSRVQQEELYLLFLLFSWRKEGRCWSHCVTGLVLAVVCGESDDFAAPVREKKCIISQNKMMATEFIRCNRVVLCEFVATCFVGGYLTEGRVNADLLRRAEILDAFPP